MDQPNEKTSEYYGWQQKMIARSATCVHKYALHRIASHRPHNHQKTDGRSFCFVFGYTQLEKMLKNAPPPSQKIGVARADNFTRCGSQTIFCCSGFDTLAFCKLNLKVQLSSFENMRPASAEINSYFGRVSLQLVWKYVWKYRWDTFFTDRTYTYQYM